MPQHVSVQPLLERYLGGDIPLYKLRGQFYSGLVELNSDKDQSLYIAVSMHLAMFTAGSWQEAELKDAIRWHRDSVNGVDLPGPIPMIGRQLMDIMISGVSPWPIETYVHEVTE